MKIIVIAGKARAGKTTLANLLVKKIKKIEGFSPIIVPFAKPIKEAAEAQGLFKDTDPAAYRKFCQDLGGTKRAENPDYWLNLFKEYVTELLAKESKSLDKSLSNDRFWKETVVIVDDCRYLNELEFARSVDAETIFVAHGDRSIDDLNGSWRNHESEAMANFFEASADLPVKWRIVNGGTLEELEEKVATRVNYLIGLHPEALCERCDCVLCTSFYNDSIKAVDQKAIDQYIDNLLKDLEEDVDDGTN